jgi:SAM-dependent methyltransferase
MRMTGFEHFCLLFQPVWPPHRRLVRETLFSLVAQERRTGYPSAPGDPASPTPPLILDVGGRNSPYTIGLPARITIMDLPRESARQQTLTLGLTDDMRTRVLRRRSNVVEVLFQDMTACTLPDNQFDGVIAIEVLEHVAQDRRFLEQVHRVLKPGGWFFMTTPNGDCVKNLAPHYNPDHLRHYSQAELTGLLTDTFKTPPQLRGLVRTGAWHAGGMRPWQLRHPLRLMKIWYCNWRNYRLSRAVRDQLKPTAHWFVTASKSGGG